MIGQTMLKMLTCLITIRHGLIQVARGFTLARIQDSAPRITIAIIIITWAGHVSADSVRYWQMFTCRRCLPAVAPAPAHGVKWQCQWQVKGRSGCGLFTTCPLEMTAVLRPFSYWPHVRRKIRNLGTQSFPRRACEPKNQGRMRYSHSTHGTRNMAGNWARPVIKSWENVAHEEIPLRPRRKFLE